MPEKDPIETELATLRLEKERLEVEALREQVSKMKAEKAQKAHNHAQVEKDINDYLARQRMNQEGCNHRKGGKGIEGLRGGGTDPMYAVIQHRMPFGDIIVLCLRCQKMWNKDSPDYKEALKFPTDNTASESSQFRVERTNA